ncbi:MAG: TIGR04053 family radical SAM/SPASM domain-containing protein [Myxococcales bacterium]|nr:TIGR04053 family radical SAM/SPASM domain-containing protein [Myxococcales bacterium]
MSISPIRIGAPYPGLVYEQAPRNVYWEMTQACDLACQHCRADAKTGRDPKELTTEEGKALLDAVGRLGSMIVLTGGDPMKRPDLWELVAYGRSHHVPMAITPAITPLLTREDVVRFREAGLTAMGVSLDGPNPEVHDGFRQVEGTFARSLEALAWARDEGVHVQVNTSVTLDTLPHLPAMFDLLKGYAPPIKRWSLFLLVPVGRGAELGVPSADDVEKLFEWVYETQQQAPFHVGTTEAPHYRRYWIQRKLAEGMPPEAIAQMAGRMAFGIRDGNGVVFVSHQGDVFPAGFLPEPVLGNVREQPLDTLYRDAPALKVLRDPTQYGGRCGRCDYKFACGGSRARAFGMQADPLADDPLCAYEPPAEA